MKETYSSIESMKDTSDTESMWNIFKSRLTKAIEEFIPHRVCSNRDRPPWITAGVKKLIRAKDHLFKKSKSRPTNNRKEKLKTLKKAINKASKQAYWKYTETILTESEENQNSNNKKLWTFVKHKKTDSIEIAPLKKNGILKDEPREKAEVLNKQFSSVFTTDSPTDFPDLKTWQKDSTFKTFPASK